MNFEQYIIKKIKLPPTFGTDQHGKPLMHSTGTFSAVERDSTGNICIVGILNGVITTENIDTGTRYSHFESNKDLWLSSASIIGFMPDGAPLTRLNLWSDPHGENDPQSEDRLLHGTALLTSNRSKHLVCTLENDHLTWAALEEREGRLYNVIRRIGRVLSADLVTPEKSSMNRSIVHLPNGGIVAATTTHFYDGHSEHVLRIIGQEATVQCGEMQALDLVHQGDRVMAVFTEGTSVCTMSIPLKDLETGIRNGTLFVGNQASSNDDIGIIPNLHFTRYRGNLTRFTETLSAFVATTVKGSGIHMSWQIWSPDELSDGPGFDVVSRIFTVNGEARYYGIRGHELYEMRLH